MSSINGASMAQMNTGTLIGIVLSSTLFVAFCLTLIFILRLSSNNRYLRTDLESRGIEIPRFGVKDVVSRKSGRYRTVLTKSPFVLTPYSGWNSSDSARIIAYDSLAANEYQDWMKRPQMGFVKQPLKKQSLILQNVDSGNFQSLNEPLHLKPREVHSSFKFPSRHMDTVPSIEAYHADEHISSPYTTAGTEMQEDLKPRPLFSQINTSLFNTEPEIKVRKKRSETLNACVRFSNGELDTSTPPRSKIHARSFSLGCQDPGKAPKTPIPPLPTSPKNVYQHSHAATWLNTKNFIKSDSQQSLSSLESVGSSFLTKSPRIIRSASAKVRYGHWRHFGNSVTLVPRTGRKTKSLQSHTLSWSGPKDLGLAKHHGLNFRNSLTLPIGKRDSITSRPDSIIEEPEDSKVFTFTAITNEVERSKYDQKEVFRTPRKPLIDRNRKDESPSKPGRNSSQSPQSTGISSTRSSNGNPFHWDPSPLNISQFSSMTGSPRSGKNQRGRSGARLSILTARKSPNPSMADISEESTPENISKSSSSNSSSSRPLPRPPSCSTFEPDIKSSLLCLRASLTPSSPALHMASFSQDKCETGDSDLKTSIDVPEYTRLGSISTVEGPRFVPQDDIGAVANFCFIRTTNINSDGVVSNTFLREESSKLNDYIHNGKRASSPTVSEIAAVTGPDTKEEANISPIRQSITILRRMNSDVKEDRAVSAMKGPERYLRLGSLSRTRDDASEKTGPRDRDSSVEREASWISLTAEKFLFGNRSRVDLGQNASDPTRNEDQKKTLSGEGLFQASSKGASIPVPELQATGMDKSPTKRSSPFRVWEDGEDFWPTVACGVADHALKSEAKALGNSSHPKGNILAKNESSPQSLYDRKGFLVENDMVNCHIPIM